MVVGSLTESVSGRVQDRRCGASMLHRFAAVL